ncbi:MAG: hypothetical protein ABSA48_16225, partial [Terracidiphilus sp.]
MNAIVSSRKTGGLAWSVTVSSLSVERVSKTFSQGDPKASEVEEGAVGEEQMFVTDQQAAELPQPCV